MYGPDGTGEHLDAAQTNTPSGAGHGRHGVVVAAASSTRDVGCGHGNSVVAADAEPQNARVEVHVICKGEE